MMKAHANWTLLVRALGRACVAFTVAAAIGGCGGEDSPTATPENCGEVTETLMRTGPAGPMEAQGRLVVVEHFTNDRCIPCKPVEVALKNIVASLGYETVVTVGNHLYWPNASDRVFLANAEQFRDRGTRFGVANMPSVWIDGVQFAEPANETAMTARITEAAAVPAVYSIVVTTAVQGDEFVVTTVVTKTAESPGTDDKLLVLALESGLAYEATPGEPVAYDDAVRSYLTGVVGRDIDLEVNQSLTYRHTITICDDWARANLEAIAFVQSDAEKKVRAAGSTF